MKTRRVKLKKMVDDVAVLSNGKCMWNGGTYDSFNEAVTARAKYYSNK